MPTLFIIVEPALIVAEDLSHALRLACAGSSVRIVAECGEVYDLLDDANTETAAFLHLPPAAFDDTALDKLLVARKVPCIFLGPLAEVEPRGRTILHSPFSDDSVANLLRHLSRTTRAVGVSGRRHSVRLMPPIEMS